MKFFKMAENMKNSKYFAHSMRELITEKIGGGRRLNSPCVLESVMG